MGAWGSASFDNDAALDWLNELAAERVTPRRSLARVAGADGYVDVDDAGGAIAAAEAVAAARGHAAKRVPVQLDVWLDANAASIAARDAKLAVAAVERVRDRSELAELWDGDAKWRAAIANLLARLARTPKRRPASKRKLPPPIEAPELRAVASPDDKLRAYASAIGGTCSVGIEGEVRGLQGGGGVFAASCTLDDVTLRWIDDTTLEIAYPRGTKVEQRDDSWFFYGRTVECRYVVRAKPKPTPARRSRR